MVSYEYVPSTKKSNPQAFMNETAGVGVGVGVGLAAIVGVGVLVVVIVGVGVLVGVGVGVTQGTTVILAVKYSFAILLFGTENLTDSVLLDVKPHSENDGPVPNTV